MYYTRNGGPSHGGEPVTLHTEMQEIFIQRIKQHGIDDAIQWIKNCCAIQNLTFPAAVRLRWNAEKEKSVLEISEDPDFRGSRIIKTEKNFCEIDNLKIGQKYYGRVNGGAVFCFETANEFPRFIRIDGLTNVRDLGGLLIKQGLVYRGCALDEDPGLNEEHTITDAGRYTFCKELGIKTELDLRLEAFGTREASPAGSEVQLIEIPYRPYKEIFEPQYRDALCRIMEVFADKSKYPIYFHCSGGADRTGMVALFLRAIAGERDADIHLDYEMTSLCFGTPRRRTAACYVEFLDMLEAYAPGHTVAEQLVCFLEVCGVTEPCRQRIRNILRGEDSQ